MSTRIVHFGADESYRVEVLAHSGYSVEACGTSLAKLKDSLHTAEVDAVAVSEEGTPEGVDIVAILRSETSAPLILFKGLITKLDPLQFDVAIAPQTNPKDWLAIFGRSIEQSHAILA